DITHAGQQDKNILQWPHLSHHLELRKEIIEVERSRAQFPFKPGSVFRFHGFGGFLDETNHVAHSQNSTSEPLRNEKLELIELFARTDEFDWPAGHFPHRQSRPAPRVAIELG